MSALPTVENPIINSAFEEPQFHWVIRKGQAPEKRPGRRDASYFFRVPEGAARGKTKKEKQRELFESDKPGLEVEIQVANQIRERLKRWKERGYAGATPITQELLAMWNREDRRERLFFAQREAAEAVIFLTEGPQDLLQGLTEQIPRDEPGPASKEKGYRAFVRYALKMATGTGKTTVMAMLAAWSILNRLYRSDDDRFTDTVLVVCPNVTIRDRLRELDPLLGEQSLYATREVVPAHLLPDLRRGDVIVTNWHHLALQEMKSVNGINAKVVKRGVPVTRTVTKTIDGEKVETQETQYLESDRANVQRVLGNRRGRSPTLMVMNDEAHHAYRRGDVADEVVLDKEMADRNDREATVWIDGLDRINKVLGGKTARNGIRLCVDLSATPFYIQGSGNEVGKPYPWIVSDFGLLDAIEAGMVKIPMLPSADMTGDERPAYFNIWRWVQAQLLKEGNPAGEPAPQDILRFAAQPIRMLTQEWEATRQKWADEFAARRRRSPAPPVFIIVCRDTALAKEVHGWLAEGKGGYGSAPECFRNQPGQVVTVRIDSKVSEEIESGSGSDEARRLRFVLETVGKTAWPGGKVPDEYAAIVAKNNQKAAEDDSDVAWIDPAIPPGRDVRCIISVAMLSEGWDATTVTHVIGLRPFGSQLLCEQVVGRALRRTHYDMNDDGLLIGEDASVLGVPFELIPFKISGTTGPVGPQEVNHVFAVEDKSVFELTFPVVEGYDDPGHVGVDIDWNRVPSLDLNPMTVPDSTLMRPMVTQDGKLLPFGPGGSQVLDLAEWRQNIREQHVAFRIAAQATGRWLEEHPQTIPTHQLFPQMLAYARQLLITRVNPMGEREKVDAALDPYFSQAVDSLVNALKPIAKERSEAEKARIPASPAGTRSTAQVNFFTTRNIWGTVQKCHLNLCVADTKKWEQSAAYCLDVHPAVAAWVKNDHLGLQIRYRKGSKPHHYIPDFIARLEDGRFLIIEVKGELGDAELKKTGALRWCSGVNRDGRFGQWSYHLLKTPVDLMKLLTEMTGQQVPMSLEPSI